MLVHKDFERDCNDHRQSDITFGFARGTRDVTVGSVQASNVFTKSAPQWKVFVMTHNQFRFPKWKRAKAAKIQCDIFSVHILCLQSVFLIEVTKPL